MVLVAVMLEFLVLLVVLVVLVEVMGAVVVVVIVVVAVAVGRASDEGICLQNEAYLVLVVTLE